MNKEKNGLSEAQISENTSAEIANNQNPNDGLGIFERLEQNVFPEAHKFRTVKKKTVNLNKPHTSKFFKINEAQTKTVYIIEIESSDEEKNIYFVEPELAMKYPKKLSIKEKICFAYMTTDLNYGLWSVSPRSGNWFLTALKVAKASRDHWVKIEPDRSTHTYNYSIAYVQYDIETKWLEGDIYDILKKYRPENYIQDENHPIVQYLLGNQMKGDDND